ncbi:MAG: hypothetical protein ABF649_14835 [Bacillus sp. (in: firmicutes)]
MSDKKKSPLASPVYTPETSKTDFPNQKMYHQNFLQDHLQNQQIAYDKLTELILAMQQTINKNQHVQQGKFEKMNHKLLTQESISNELLTSIADQQSTSKSYENKLEALEVLAAENTKVLAKEATINQAILDQVSYQEQTVRSLTSQIQDFSNLSNQMNDKLDKADKNYQHVAETLELQEIFHQTLVEKMDANEANMNKITRELDMLKSIIFERFHSLTDKLETNFKSISKPVQRFFLQKEKEPKQ